MKSPWQMGLLAVVVAGVSMYDVVFYTKHRARSRVTGQVQVSRAFMEDSAQTAAPSVEPAPLDNLTEPANAEPAPPISREDLQRYAQQQFVWEEIPDDSVEREWPRRDPFKADKEAASENLVAQNIPLIRYGATHQRLPEPQCSFSGTLIEKERKLALIDGAPRSIGDRIGVWQLADIEADYVILKSADQTRRIELGSEESRASFRKDPS